MGITGLLPFLDKSSKKVNISEFSGCTVVIDTYCWLHKGAFSCADKIVMGQKTDAYVKYCIKYINMLLSFKIKPILVFDGRHLPAKAETEVKRRESREATRKRAAELIKMGKDYEGRNLLRRSLDVSHAMALEVMKQCQAHNIDCIVAPYEADAQLAYLNISGIADIVITEDSDLTLFGCKKILFKMDIYGNGILVEQEKLHISMGLTESNFDLDKFRYMCILSGCDYLSSLPGIGLQKACKFIVKNRDTNIYNALQRLGSVLNMKTLVMTKEYRDGFLRALVTFKHQLVFCPLTRQQKRLFPPTPDVTEEQLQYAGTEIEHELAWQMALGNCDPFTQQKLHDFDPDKVIHRKTNSWSELATAPHKSIWSTQYTVKSNLSTPKKDKKPVPKANSKGKVATLNTDKLKKEITPKKRTYEEAILSTEELIQLYYVPPSSNENVASAKKVLKLEPEANNSTDDEKSSPLVVKRENPFKKSTNPNELSPSLLNKVRKRLPVRNSLFKSTVIDDNVVKHSKFFLPPTPSSSDVSTEEYTLSDSRLENITESMVPNVDSQNIKEDMNLSLGQYSNMEDDLSQDLSAKLDTENKCNESPKKNTIRISPKNIFSRSNKSLDITRTISSCENQMVIDNAEDNNIMDYSASYDNLSETKSSLFPLKESYNRPQKLAENNFIVNRTVHSKAGKVLNSSQRKSSSKNYSKKNTTITGQQSLLQMFGFQKKTSLKH